MHRDFLKILYVENDLDEKGAALVLEKSSRRLKPTICNFQVVSNGFFALEYCEHTNYDVMMVQHGDENMEGDALIRILRNIGNSIPLILLVDKVKAVSLMSKADETMLLDQQIPMEPGSPEFDSTIENCIHEKGYSGILYKPYSSKRLCEAIKKAIVYGNSMAAIKKMAVLANGCEEVDDTMFQKDSTQLADDIAKVVRDFDIDIDGQLLTFPGFKPLAEDESVDDKAAYRRFLIHNSGYTEGNLDHESLVKVITRKEIEAASAADTKIDAMWESYQNSSANIGTVNPNIPPKYLRKRLSKREQARFDKEQCRMIAKEVNRIRALLEVDSTKKTTLYSLYRGIQHSSIETLNGAPQVEEIVPDSNLAGVKRGIAAITEHSDRLMSMMVEKKHATTVPYVDSNSWADVIGGQPTISRQYSEESTATAGILAGFANTSAVPK